MLGDLSSPRHLPFEIANFKGLLTNVEDARAIPAGYLITAQNVVFDANGNIRPRDGSETWWPAISQRNYLAEMELGENGSWAGGTADSTLKKYGYQSRFLNATGNMVRSFTALDLYLNGDYNATNTFINFWVRVDTRANVVSMAVDIASDAGFANMETFAVSMTTDVTADATWVKVTKQLGTGTITGTPNYNAVIRLRFSIVKAAGAAQVNVDEVYTSYTLYTKSRLLGGIEFRKLTTSQSYTLAVFGETIYSDFNEAQAPDKIWSQQRRETPTYMAVFEDRCAIFNGTDPNLIFTGSTVRVLGYPAPVANPTLASPGGAVTGALTPGATYYYGVTFVYGEGSVRHGESSMLEDPTPVVIGVSQQVNLTVIPVGDLGSGVVARRIYRNIGDSGQFATKYFVAEVSNNTATTYSDITADTTIVTAPAGPLDNGVPPVSRLGKWYEKGMVYATDRELRYSRPGTNLSQSGEIVPALNIIPLGTAGRICWLMEFNGVLYVGQERGLGKCQWNGSTLLYRAVQRSGEGSEQNVGGYDQRAVTVVDNRYLMWWDSQGQIWKMLPNEEIFQESEPIANLTADFNSLPLASSLDYYTLDSDAQWNTGTMAATPNIEIAAGALKYKDDVSQTAVVVNTGDLTTQFNNNVAVSCAGFQDLGGASSQGQFPPGYINLQSLNTTSSTKINFGNGGRLFGALLNVITERQLGAGTLNWTIEAHKEKPEGGGFAYGSTVLASVSGTINVPFGIAALHDTWAIGGAFNTPVYIPGGESVVLVLSLSGAGSPGFLPETINPSAYPTITASVRPPSIVSSFVLPGARSLRYSLIGADAITFNFNVAGNEVTPQPTAQRWFAATMTDVQIQGGSKITIELETSPDGVVWSNRQTIYQADFAAEHFPTLSPVVAETRNLYALPDFRFGQPYPHAPHAIHARVFHTIYPQSHGGTPATEAQSRVSTDVKVSFPWISASNITMSTEAAFPLVYDKKDYLRDIWTSEIVNAGSLASFGKLAVDYALNQQSIFFQVRSANGSGNIPAATWVDVPPNTILGALGVVASATHFQLRIIFQDDDTKFVGAASLINTLTLSWAGVAATHAPILPPCLFYYKNYIFGSWSSKASRLPDSSLALDAYKETYEDVAHRFSTFSAPHYASYMTVGGKLIGGPVSGGQLMRLRNSNNVDGPLNVAAGFDCYVTTHPLAMSSTKLKTLHWAYIGMNLNIHNAGRFIREASNYPSAVRPFFEFFVAAAAISQANALSLANTLGAYLLTFYGAQRGYQYMDLQLPHSGDAASIAPLGLWSFKPYIQEYGFDVGLQEKAFTVGMRFRSYRDLTTGLVYMPTITNLGLEYYLENIRGV